MYSRHLATILRPWHDTLGTMRLRLTAEHHHIPTDNELPRMWIEWTDPNHVNGEPLPTPGRSRVLQAIELFVLLAMIDPVAWQAVLLEMNAAGDCAIDDTFAVGKLGVPVRVCGYELRFTTFEDAAVWCKYLVEDDDDNDVLSENYAQARAALEGIAARGCVHATHPLRIPVRLRLAPRAFFPDVREVMPAVLALTGTQHNLKKAVDPPKCRLAKFCSRITELFNQVTALRESDGSFSGEALQLHDNGVKVAVLPAVLSTDSLISERGHGWIVRTVNALLGATTGDGAVGAEHAMVGPRPPLEQTLGILGAVAHSNSLKFISADFSFAWGISDADKLRCVHWLAYALFSPHARNHPTRIHVTATTLTCQCVEWVEELLRAEDPLELLFPDDCEAITVHKQLRVSTSKVELMNPVGDASNGAQTIVDDAIFEDLRILGKVEHWWVVLLPGWGRTWVSDAHATVSTVEVSTAIMQPTAPFIRPIHELAIMTDGFSDEGRSSTAALLRLLGAAVRYLGLYDSLPPNELWCERIFDCCPQIATLHYHSAAPNQLQEFLGAFENGRLSHLQHLFLVIYSMSGADVVALTRMIAALASKTHVIAQMKSFSVKFVDLEYSDDARVDPAILTEALEMLSQNTRLTTFELALPLGTTTSAHVDQLREGFALHHNVVLPSLLRLREKAAFLSVVEMQSRGEPRSESAIQQLDQGILGAIFQFAATPSCRTVQVHLPPIQTIVVANPGCCWSKYFSSRQKFLISCSDWLENCW